MTQTAAQQKSMFNHYAKNYAFMNSLKKGCDYFLVGLIDGIHYYLPNDESMGGVVAVDWENEIMCDTFFYEMDDIEYPNSDYKFLNHHGVLMPAFEAERERRTA